MAPLLPTLADLRHWLEFLVYFGAVLVALRVWWAALHLLNRRRE